MSNSEEWSRRSHTTPPQSYLDSPLTPPPTDELRSPQLTKERHFSSDEAKSPRDVEGEQSLQARVVIDTFESIRSGRVPYLDPWTRIPLGVEQYDYLLQELEKDTVLRSYVEKDIRYDYNRCRGEIIFRMPTTLHELLISKVVEDIVAQLNTVSSSIGRAGRFARGIEHVGSSTVSLSASDSDPTALSKRQPDASFRHVDAEYPGVVIEVSYSQKRKDLPYLADDYLLGSDGSIRMMIGLDVEYLGSQKATLSVWRPQYTSKGEQEELRVVQTEQVIRNEDGTPSSGPGLSLRLHDFANEELTEDLRHEAQKISISSEKLCAYLANAERFNSRLPPTFRSKHRVKAGVIKRRRSETPPVTITSDDEARYQKEEERAAKRVALHDPEYEPRSGSDSPSG
ncbi:hypothetical protein B0A49_13401 [Cryomyces minteri]|uniref:Restriction endonuclease domain-containing protein n=1 Tax=Cryomyces minteri TaxID=331657 RepID=A0A4U0WC56_9PEZI|nr:hypothetical protein B0A49_13401 [Cryomyces minteri]